MQRVVLGVALTTAAVLAGAGLKPVAAQSDASKPAFYTEKVKPIFVANCGQCHLGGGHRGGFAMDTKESMMKGGRDGAVIVPGDPANSLLVKLIRHEGPPDDPKPMPPRSKLSDADIATVQQWIKAGAVMPADAQ